MPRFAIYARISTDDVQQKYSLQKQEEVAASFCRQRFGEEWRAPRTYRDRGSGRDMKRPGLQAMLLDAESNLFRALVVFSVDRLSRNARDFLALLDRLNELSVTFLSATEPFDTAEASGKMMLQALASFAEFERNAISERVGAASAKRARAGHYLGSRPPFGYDLVRGQGLVVKPDEAAVVRRVFEIYAEERVGITAITRTLNGEGIPTRSGTKWSRPFLSRMLTRPIYVGRVGPAGDRPGRHQAIVDEGLFEKAQEVRKRGRRPAARRARTYALKGIIRCGSCSRPMQGMGGRSYVCYGKYQVGDCAQENVRLDVLERALLAEIRSLFLDDDLMEKIHQKARSLLGQGTNRLRQEIAGVESEALRLTGLMDGICRALENGSATPQVCSTDMQRLRARLGLLDDRKGDLVATLAAESLPPLDRRLLRAAVEQLEQAMARSEHAQKRLWFRTFLKRVVAERKESVRVLYRLPLSRQPGLPVGEFPKPRAGAGPEVCLEVLYLRPQLRGHCEGNVNVYVGSGQPPPPVHAGTVPRGGVAQLSLDDLFPGTQEKRRQHPGVPRPGA